MLKIVFRWNKFELGEKKTHFRYEFRDDPVVDPQQNFKINFYYQILDSAIQSLNDRFVQLEGHGPLFSFLYNISSTDNYEYVMKCCKDLEIALTSDDSLSFDINAIELCEEIIALHRHLKMEESDHRRFYNIHICKNKLIEIFPNVYVALRILLTIPVTAASAERSFSKFKIIKNYLRSTISQDRLVGLATISIEYEIADDLDIDDLVKDFAALKARKLNF